MVAFFGNETASFETVGIKRDLFDIALALRVEMLHQNRGKQGALRTNREKLLFPMIFMRKGVEVLELLVVNSIKTREHIVERAKTIPRLSTATLLRGGAFLWGKQSLRLPMQLSSWTAPCVRYGVQKDHLTKPKFFAGSTLCMA